MCREWWCDFWPLRAHRFSNGMFTHNARLSLILNTPPQAQLGSVSFRWCSLRLVFGERYPLSVVVLPLKLASQESSIWGLSWIANACRLLGLWWRCRSSEDSCWCLEGRHLLPERALKWSDSALRYALCVHGSPGSEPDRYCSYCHSKGGSDPWWEHPDPSKSSEGVFEYMDEEQGATSSMMCVCMCTYLVIFHV